MSNECISDVRYWRRRLREARELHHAIFRCPADRWERIAEKHREILARLIQPRDSILDAGCGWGRLLDLLPPTWDGRYLGVDLSPDFVRMAQELHPRREFVVTDLRRLDVPDTFDVAVLISMRPMIRRNLGDEAWAEVESRLRDRVSRILYLEYDESSEGSVE